jgi:hypothetical protein
MLLASLLLSVPAASLADDPDRTSISLTARTGLLGHGLDLSYPLSDRLSIRAGFGNWTRSDEVDEGDTTYSGKLTLGGAMVVADWFPFRGNFRLSAGLVGNRSKVELAGRSTGTVTFGGTTYDAADITASGKISYEKTAPYLGFGFGNPSARSRFGFFAEFGAAYQRPGVALNATCNTGATTCSNDAAFQTSVAEEQREIQADADDFKWYPVVQLGISMRF